MTDTPSQTQPGFEAMARPSDAQVRRIGRRYHVHLPGFVYVVTTVVLVLGAINGQNNLLFALFGLAVGGLVVSGLLSGANLVGIAVQRMPPVHGLVGEQVTVRYRVRNRNFLMGAFAVTIEEVPPTGSRGPHRLGPVRGFAAYIPARKEVIVEARGWCLSRGGAELARVRAVSTFPFGLTRKSVAFEQRQRIRIRPRIAPLPRSVLASIDGREPRGGRPRPWRGGDEFWALREYAPGDGVRSIAWKPTARLDRLIVRDRATGGSRRLWIEIHATNATQDDVEHTLCAAAGLVNLAYEAGFAVGVRTEDGAVLSPLRTGRAYLWEALDALAEWPAPRQALPVRSGNTAEGSSVLVVSARHPSVDGNQVLWGADPSLFPPGFSPRFEAPTEDQRS